MLDCGIYYLRPYPSFTPPAHLSGYAYVRSVEVNGYCLSYSPTGLSGCMQSVKVNGSRLSYSPTGLSGCVQSIKGNGSRLSYSPTGLSGYMQSVKS